MEYLYEATDVPANIQRKEKFFSAAQHKTFPKQEVSNHFFS